VESEKLGSKPIAAILFSAFDISTADSL